MPTWTLGVIMSASTQALGNRSDIAASTASFWANQAQMDVWNLLPHDAQEALAVSSTTVNEDKISLPTDFQELLNLSNMSRSNVLLTQVNNDQLAAFESTYSGVPTNYALYATWLELRPIPDSAYSLALRYKKQLSEMTATTAVPSVATRLRPAIFARTVQLLAENVTLDADRAARAERSFARAMGVPSDRALRHRDQHALGMSLSWRGKTTRQTADNDFDTRID